MGNLVESTVKLWEYTTPIGAIFKAMGDHQKNYNQRLIDYDLFTDAWGYSIANEMLFLTGMVATYSVGGYMLASAMLT